MHKLGLWLVSGLVGLTLLLGLMMIPNAGLSWDEPIQLNYGHIVWDYVHGVFSSDYAEQFPEKTQRIKTYKDKYYGPFFELVLVGVQKLSGARTFSEFIVIRHWATFVFFGCGVICLYFLSLYAFTRIPFNNHFSDRVYQIAAGLTALSFLLTPRILGHGFMNSKDIPFMIMFLVCMTVFLRVFEQPNRINVSALGLFTGLLICIRIGGVFAPFIWTLVMVRQWALKASGGFVWKGMFSGTKSMAGYVALFLVAASLTIVTFWPTLWFEPLGFLSAIRQMAQFPWSGTVFYLGNDVLASELPWHYALVWMAVTIPVLTLALSMFGVFRGLSLPFVRQSMVMQTLIAWLFVPLGVIVLSGAVLYDGWRHLFFIYPAMVVLQGIGGLLLVDWAKHWLVSRKLLRVGVGVISCMFGVYVLFLVSEVYSRKAYTYVSFNSIGHAFSRPVQHLFEQDYWGVSYKALWERVSDLETIDERDDTKHLAKGRTLVYTPHYPGKMSYFMVSSDVRQTTFFSGLQLADIYMTNFRWADRLLVNDAFVTVDIYPGWFRDSYPISGLIKL